MSFKQKLAGVAAVPMALGVAASVHATESGIDVSGAESSLSNVEGALTTIGGVIIGLAAVAVGFKWVKGMIFS